MGFIPDEDYAKGNQRSANIALSILARRMGMEMKDVAESILEISAKKIIRIMEPMLRAYNLKSDSISLVGGGGGASVLVPYFSSKTSITVSNCRKRRGNIIHRGCFSHDQGRT